LAAAHSFKAVIGVEYDQGLAQIAETNLRKKGYYLADARNSVICADAGEYSLPDEDVVIYLYNPFESEVMRRALKNICTPSSKKRYIIYYHPVLASELFDNSPHLELIQNGPTIFGRPKFAFYKVTSLVSTTELDRF
jgi:hypothetical protein